MGGKANGGEEKGIRWREEALCIGSAGQVVMREEQARKAGVEL